MNLYVSEIDDEKSIVFFPKNLSLFLTSNSIGETAKMISEGKTYDAVRENYREVTQHDYDKLRSLYENTSLDVGLNLNHKRLQRLVLNISNDCNMDCAYCYANGGNYHEKADMMSTKTLIKILETMYGKFQEIELIQLFGGEPMLNEAAVVATCEFIKKNKKITKVGMVSNGTIITEDLIKLVSNNELSITISLDGEQVHDELRKFKNGKGTFEIIKKNILKLRAISKEPSCIEVTYSKYHQDKGISIKDISKEIRNQFPGVWVHIVEVASTDENYKNTGVTNILDSVTEELETIHRLEEVSLTMVDRFMSPLKRKKTCNHFCNAGFDSISVTTKGDIYPCSAMIGKKGHYVGNIYDEENALFDSIEKMRLKYLNHDRRIDGKCKECFANTICTGCLFDNYINTGELLVASEEFCAKARACADKILKGIVLIRNK